MGVVVEIEVVGLGWNEGGRRLNSKDFVIFFDFLNFVRKINGII